MTLCDEGFFQPTHLIKPTYASLGASGHEYDAYVLFIEQILRDILPPELLFASATAPEYIALLNAKLPFLSWNISSRAPCTVCVSLLCHSDQTNGVGRYLCDILARWLVPGKFLNISSVRSLGFNFVCCPDYPLYFQQVLIDIETDQQLSVVRGSREALEKEILLSILAVRHARQVVSIKKLSSEQKKTLIEENIASVISKSATGQSAFDQMHSLWLHVNGEDKIQQLQEQFSPFLDSRPKVFDSSIYQEIRHSLSLFGEKFAASRDIRHVSRLISYQYLFRKTLLRHSAESPSKRHLSIKVLPVQSSAKGAKVLGILGAMNVLQETERFEERHIEEAITECLPSVRKVDNSCFLDRKNHDSTRVFYVEIEKVDGSAFSLDETKELKKNLPNALKTSVESILYPVLMPRNEEEVMRNIVLLSQELKYLRDLPQVIISFSAQTEHSVQFTIILLRILRDTDLPLPTLFAHGRTDLKIEGLEVKKVGLVRKRYPKEASVFTLSLNKQKFLRRDFTIDLFKARQKLSQELDRILGGIRDFNGGILSKQQEVFQAFKKLVKHTGPQHELLMDNFFHSLTPPLRQTFVAPTTLQTLFCLTQEAFDADYKKKPFLLKTQFQADQALTVAASPYPEIKTKLFAKILELNIPPSELSCTQVSAYGITCIGYIYQNSDPHVRSLFHSELLKALAG